MKFTRLNAELDNISRLPDRPNVEQGLTSIELKECFDKAGEDIKAYINTVLIRELESEIENSSGADRIGCSALSTLSGSTVRENLEQLCELALEAKYQGIGTGEVVMDNLDPPIQNFLNTVSNRVKKLFVVGRSTFIAERSGTYKITLVAGGAGGGVDTENNNVGLGGGGGGTAVTWVDLNEGDECIFDIGSGGKGMRVSNNTIVAHAEQGLDTVLMVGDELIASAAGGATSADHHLTTFGGYINYNGGCPKPARYCEESSTKLELLKGGDSMLGKGAEFVEDQPGIGGGGYAGSCNNSIYRSGTKGGDGVAFIEYLQ